MADIEYRLKITFNRMAPYKMFYALYEDDFPHVALNIHVSLDRANTC
jgi:hypothetical protein